MAQACKICKHSDRQAIDAALLEGYPALRVLGAQYSVSKDSLSIHWHSHVDDGDEPNATDSVLNNQNKSNGGIEPRQSNQDKAGIVLKQGKTITPEEAEVRYTAFIERWRHNIGIALDEMAGWPEKGEDLQALISEGIERGDLFYYAGLKWYCKTAQCIRRMNRDK
jgi:hypothetical protein